MTGKRRILEIICWNFSLDGAGRVATLRKPFDMLAEQLVLKDGRESRGRVELFLASVAEWKCDVLRLVLAA